MVGVGVGIGVEGEVGPVGVGGWAGVKIVGWCWGLSWIELVFWEFTLV